MSRWSYGDFQAIVAESMNHFDPHHLTTHLSSPYSPSILLCLNFQFINHSTMRDWERCSKLIIFMLSICLAIHITNASFHKRLSLVWNDDFDGDALDISKWDYEINCLGGGNNEKQCYTSRDINVYVRNGYLHLHPIPITYQGSLDGCTDNTQNSCTWIQPSSSGRIRTLRSVSGSWLYGRFEVRASLPVGDFLWPAIWMLPTDNVYGTWAASGEIDIMESRGQEPNSVSGTLHYGGQWPHNVYNSSGNIFFPYNFTSGFHTFIVDWDPKQMRWYVDGKPIFYQNLDKSFGPIYDHNGAPFDKRFHFILNCAVAGNFFPESIYGPFDIKKAAPTWKQPFIIDYVRVYQ